MVQVMCCSRVVILGWAWTFNELSLNQVLDLLHLNKTAPFYVNSSISKSVARWWWQILSSFRSFCSWLSISDSGHRRRMMDEERMDIRIIWHKKVTLNSEYIKMIFFLLVKRSLRSQGPNCSWLQNMKKNIYGYILIYKAECLWVCDSVRCYHKFKYISFRQFEFNDDWLSFVSWWWFSCCG